MKGTSLISVVALMAVCSFSGCDVDVKDPGKAPDVDVSVQPGRAPDVEIRGPDVDVSTKEKEVTVPDVDINSKKVKVSVPDVDIKIPKENENEPTPKP